MAVSRKKVTGKGLKKTVIKTVEQSEKKNIDKSLTTQMVQDRAYYIWEEKGKHFGQDQEIWIQAEKEMTVKIK